MSIMLRCILLLWLVCPASALRAQPRALSTSFDISVGVGRGNGGPTVSDRGMLSGSLLLSTAVKALPTSVLVIAVSASADMLWSFTDCLQEPGQLLGTCQTFPSHASLGVLAGWAMRDHQGSGVRLFAGPGYYTTNSDGGLGLTARLDGAERLTSRLSFVFWTQAHLFPSVADARLTTTSAGIGLRLVR